MPLALMAIGSNIDTNKYEVIIIDGRLKNNPEELIAKHLPQAICFGVTVLTGSPLKDAIKKSDFVKSLNPNIPVIWGGWHPSLFPTDILKDTPSVDITVQGQGEITFNELINCLEQNDTLANINGICFRDKKGEIIKNKARVLTPMDTLPKVNYSLIDVEEYFKLKKKRQLDYISSTGCFFRCTFCADPFVFNRSFTAISASKMGEELEELYKKYEFTDLNFQDETFFTYPKRIEEVANELINRNIKTSWAATMRADQGYRMSEEQFELCVKSGLRRVLIGVESGSQEMMDWLSKDIKLEQVLFCADRCKKYNVGVIFPFIVGFPNESDESIIATRKLVQKLAKMSTKFETPIFYFKPYPGSKITDDVVKNGYKLPNSTLEWGKFDYIGSKGPWVSKSKYSFFERYKFYIKAAYGKTKTVMLPFKWLSLMRFKLNFFKLPFEKWLFDLMFKKQKLS